MYSVTRLLDVADGERDRVLTAARAVAASTMARRQLVEPTLPGVRNGGDILVHLRFDNEHQWRSAEPDFVATLTDSAITRVNGACYSGDASLSGPQAGTVYRALLLRVLPGTDSRIVARFEDELRLMPRYVNTITAWQLSRVDEAVGTSEWTHVFEQEFTDVDGVMGPYLMHPIHWALVDRWFDPECPDVIVRARVCHSFCALGDSVLC
jgi:hypothetical protein